MSSISREKNKYINPSFWCNGEMISWGYPRCYRSTWVIFLTQLRSQGGLPGGVKAWAEFGRIGQSWSGKGECYVGVWAKAPGPEWVRFLLEIAAVSGWQELTAGVEGPAEPPGGDVRRGQMGLFDSHPLQAVGSHGKILSLWRVGGTIRTTL